MRQELPQRTRAVVLDEPRKLSLRELDLTPPSAEDAVVELAWSGISTGTERLLWSGAMPPFPGMGYPLVPGYESVGRVTHCGTRSGRTVGETVFVPGAACFGEVHGLFGGAASRLVTPGHRLLPVDPAWEEESVLLALAATAFHAAEMARDGLDRDRVSGAPGNPKPTLIVGHGVLGRLLARLLAAEAGESPVVWESNPARRTGADGYEVVGPEDDGRRDYDCIIDVSGDAAVLDAVIPRLAPRGRIVLAGFYSDAVSFAFPPAFLREAQIRVSAEWAPSDLQAVKEKVECGRLSLAGLITHRTTLSAGADIDLAYETAFNDPNCLKMVLDWRTCS